MNNFLKTLLIALSFMGTSNASNLFYESENFSNQINFFSPIGQTFTITNPNTLFFGFKYVDCNVHIGDSTIIMTLFEGEGISGSQLIQDSFPASNEANGIQYLDVSSIVFIQNNTYTVQVFSENARGCYADNNINYLVVPAGPDYPGGHEFYENAINPDRDMVFHLLDDAVDLTIDATTPNQVLIETQFDVAIHVENLSGSTSINTDLTIDTDLNIIATSGCLNDPNGFPTCTIANLSKNQTADITLTLNSQTPVPPGSAFFGVDIGNDTFEIETSNNTFQSNIEVLSNTVFNDGFE